MSAHDAVNTANLESARRAGWPELTGTPKQIGWAATIRAARMREFDATDSPASAMTDAARAAVRGVLLEVTAASDWIDTQSNPHWHLVLLVLRRTPAEIAALGSL
ncbi:hypothetical protein ACIO52_31820 [Nocardia sp. NPDC087230]|uniref:hypothetical protein n=1 Tax=Nocardia sp. NPDC087230 TaxID=3364331 RepID=UPI0037F6744C